MSRPGDYIHEIWLVTYTKVKGPLGGLVEVATRSEKPVRGKVTPLSGDERWRAQAVSPSVSHKVNIPWSPNLVITPKMSLYAVGKRLNVTAAYNVETKNREIEVLCEEAGPIPE